MSRKRGRLDETAARANAEPPTWAPMQVDTDTFNFDGVRAVIANPNELDPDTPAPTPTLGAWPLGIVYPNAAKLPDIIKRQWSHAPASSWVFLDSALTGILAEGFVGPQPVAYHILLTHIRFLPDEIAKVADEWMLLPRSDQCGSAANRWDAHWSLLCS